MEKISLKKAMINDRFLFSAFLMVIVFLFILIGIGIGGSFEFSAENFGMYIVLLWIGLSLIFSIIRIIQLSKFKSDRRPYLAEVTKTFSYRGAKRISFTYKVDGVIYKGGNFVMSNKLSKGINKGDQVEINISESNPKAAFIREIYFDVKV